MLVSAVQYSGSVIYTHIDAVSLVFFSEQVEATCASVVSRADFDAQKFSMVALWELHDKKGKWTQGNRQGSYCMCLGGQ